MWLGVTGRLPFRTARFLDDAHRRGVLRQNGARYTFRHIKVQVHRLHAGKQAARSPVLPRTGDFSPVEKDGCAGVAFAREIRFDGQFILFGEVGAAGTRTRTSPPQATPERVAAVQVTIRRTDNAPCTATLSEDCPGLEYRGILGSS